MAQFPYDEPDHSPPEDYRPVDYHPVEVDFDPMNEVEDDD